MHQIVQWFIRRFRPVCLGGALLLLLLPAASSPAEQPVDFDREIRPILASRCFRCHGPDAESREAGLRLDVRDEAVAELATGERAIVPGEPAASVLLERITAEDPAERMPPQGTGDALSAEQQDLLRRWIGQGAEYTQHWSLIAPTRPTIPMQLSNSAWPRNAIDHFVLARLDREQLEPSPEADPAALIRRVSLDLTGLPPTLDEVDRFLADERPDAYDHLVDRLLQSEAYGERWARVWLDLARYADSAGYAQDPPRTIWKYRDWVIRAINENMPFDQFTIEQIAGDMLPYPSERQLLATAFHRNTMTNSEGGTDDEEFRNAAVVDRVNTTMQVWMGLTMGCAQCHTHKYDPITQEEYFRVFAIFNNTEDADKGDESPVLETLTDEQRQKRADLQQQIAELEQQLKSTAADSNAQLPVDGPLAARYVRIELPGKKVFLSLAEVQAFSGDKNLAPAGTASQISVDYEGPARLAIDDNTDGDYFTAKSTTHTAAENDPWWELDLGQSHALDRIVVWNRTDGETGSRLKQFRVVLLDEQRRPVFIASEASSPSPSKAFAVPARADQLTEAQRAELEKYHELNSPELLALRARLEELGKQLAGIQGVTTPIMRELPADQRRATHIQIRGNFLDKGAEVTPGVPAALHPLPEDADANRLALARWLVDSRNPLTARVVANRFWEQLFGKGLVETSEDFGVQGEKPSHPELLDYLAVELMETGWDTKQLVRRIVTSATYRQSSRVTPQLAERDPDNQLLTRGPRYRLPAEMIRDQALHIAGLLSRKMYGPSVQPPRPVLGLRAAFGGSTDWQTSPGEDKYRRGLYTSWRRTTPYPSMTTFDAPSREVGTIRRIPTNTPLQALVTLNDPVYIEAAQALARRMMTEGGDAAEQRVSFAFRLCTARGPKEEERRRLVDLYEAARQRFSENPEAATKMATDPLGPAPEQLNVTELAAWTVVANVLLNLDEVLARR